MIRTHMCMHILCFSIFTHIELINHHLDTEYTPALITTHVYHAHLKDAQRSPYTYTHTHTHTHAYTHMHTLPRIVNNIMFNVHSLLVVRVYVRPLCLSVVEIHFFRSRLLDEFRRQLWRRFLRRFPELTEFPKNGRFHS